MQNIEILLDECRGINIPRDFVNEFHLDLWDGINPDDVKICLAGDTIENECYWDAWHDICDNATYTEDGQTWHLWQDGCLFAINYDALSDEEYLEFFGEARD